MKRKTSKDRGIDLRRCHDLLKYDSNQDSFLHCVVRVLDSSKHSIMFRSFSTRLPVLNVAKYESIVKKQVKKETARVDTLLTHLLLMLSRKTAFIPKVPSTFQPRER
jgi:hypothetical protein